MFTIASQAGEERPGTIGRREWLRVGGIALLGLSSQELSRMRALAAPDDATSAYRSNSCVFIFLFGGPSHIDLWDMKPEAPVEIRGEFRPVPTRVPGIELCEHLPLLAQQAEKLCLLRSMTHRMPVHGPACSEMSTGREYFGPPTTDQARPEDWPSLSAVTMRYRKWDRGMPPSVVIPWYLQFAGQDNRIAGQTGGRMGERYNAFLVDKDPSHPDFHCPEIRVPADVPIERIAHRRDLLCRFDAGAAARLGAGSNVVLHSNHTANAFEMLSNPSAANAFELDREPSHLRERYGSGKFAQSLLLARRLVEAGVSLVTVNWEDGSRFDKVSPFWDTHHHNFETLKHRLLPVFDRAFSAFLEDLALRGLLARTLVVVTGEFGRTPKIGQVVQNGMTQKTGRDHWPHAFTVLLAGGGVRGGQVYGMTNSIGAYVEDNPVSPADLTATILHHLGIDPTNEYRDEFQQMRNKLSKGNPIKNLG